MKRFALITMGAALVLGMSACGTDPDMEKIATFEDCIEVSGESKLTELMDDGMPRSVASVLVMDECGWNELTEEEQEVAKERKGL